MTSKVYVLVHGCLSPIQRGIQGAHSVVELVHANVPNGKKPVSMVDTNPVLHWAEIDKTLIFLEAGFSAQLKDWIKRLKKLGIEHAVFKEDAGTLERCTTAVAFLLQDDVVESVTTENAGLAWSGDARRTVFRSKMHEFVYNLKRLKKA